MVTLVADVQQCVCSVFVYVCVLCVQCSSFIVIHRTYPPPLLLLLLLLAAPMPSHNTSWSMVHLGAGTGKADVMSGGQRGQLFHNED